jgi:hypothetical protein
MLTNDPMAVGEAIKAAALRAGSNSSARFCLVEARRARLDRETCLFWCARSLKHSVGIFGAEWQAVNAEYLRALGVCAELAS